MLFSKRKLLGLIAAVAMVPTVLAGTARAEDKPVLVFAAASLKEALTTLATGFQKETGKVVQISFAASGALAKQVEAGAPADLFISADTKWMTYLSGKDLTVKDTEMPLLGNTLVLVAPKDAAVDPVTLGKGFDLGALLAGGKLAMGDPSSVPAGTYGKTALENLGIYDGVKDKVALTENVRAALALVARGEAPFGIVYGTDAAADPTVKVVATFPADSYPAIVYPIAVLKESANPDAKAFYAYLQTAPAAAVFTAQGFTVMKAPATN